MVLSMKQMSGDLTDNTSHQRNTHARGAPLLTKDEEVDLSSHIRAGAEAKVRLMDGAVSRSERTKLKRLVSDGELAWRRLVESNIRLVMSAANRYRDRGLDIDDLIQEGSLGLMTAARKFDGRRGFKFSTYAYIWITRYIRDALKSQATTIRIPRDVVDDIYRLKGWQEQIYDVKHREATVTELAELMGMGVDRVLKLMEIRRSLVSLDQMVGDSANKTLGELIADPNADIEGDALDEVEWKSELAAMLDQLSERQAAVVRMRFGIGTTHPHSLTDVGKHLGVSRQAVHCLEQGAIARLRMETARRGFADT